MGLLEKSERSRCCNDRVNLLNSKLYCFGCHQQITGWRFVDQAMLIYDLETLRALK